MANNNLQTVLVKIIKEEIALMREQANPIFNKLSDARRADIASWLMRQYFDAEKNSASRWYDPDVSKDTVLDFISKSSNKFPLSPVQVVDFYRNMKSIQGSISSKDFSDELDKVSLDDEPKNVNRTGPVSLKDIGDSVGGVTAAMVNKIENDGLSKLQDLTNGKNPQDLTPKDEKALEQKLRAAEVSAASLFADMLKDSSGNIGKFLMSLTKSQIISDNESSMISDQEIEALLALSNMSKREIVHVLKKDLNNPRGNLIKTFQSMYSKTLFPPKKRGPKPKNQE